VLAKSLDPEPIPLQVKIILLGNADFYYSLYNREEDFSQLFKVKAEFDMVMPRTSENESAYATFVASRCREEQLRHFQPTAVARLVEFGARMSGHQNKLSTRMEIVADVVREASFWAGHNGREEVTADDVQTTLDERRTRSNLDEEYIMEHIADGSLAIDVRGTAVGQANGLSIIDLGDYTYGQPGRISARTFRSEQGIINIDREVELTGPIHHKGLLSLIGYLGGTYAQEKALTIAASITFEQNYGLIEGDSASTAELCALLSSLAHIPLKQSIAVTGAVNQYGQILPIGGVTEKVEGFFHVCQLEDRRKT
jgi:predicted ATP-dependent protease